MNYLAYTPSCEAYIASAQNGKMKCYDVSKDIANLSITLRTNDSSEFTLRLANKNRKYDGLFQSMDRIAIYANKTERYRLLTGYINSVTALQLYGGEIELHGYCPIYRLQQLYWDPRLKASSELLSVEDSPFDNAVERVIYNLLVNVGGYDRKNIALGSIPFTVVSWAREMYEAQTKDLEQAVNVVKAFDETLGNHGPQLTSAGTASYSFNGTIAEGENLEIAWDFLYNQLKWTKIAAAACIGTWMCESGCDPTSIEGIFDEPLQIGPRKKAAMEDWQGYCLGSLFPAYAGRLSINHAAYRGTDGIFYPGIAIAGYTGPRVNDLFDAAKRVKKPWYSWEANFELFASELGDRYAYLQSDDFQKDPNIGSAVNKFVLCYEMPGGIPAAWLANRINNAQGVLNRFG